jgi:hypothetical protein
VSIPLNSSPDVREAPARTNVREPKPPFGRAVRYSDPPVAPLRRRRAPPQGFWRKDPASLKPFGQKGNSGGVCDTFPVIVFGQKLCPTGFVLLGGSTGGFLAMVRVL